MKAKAFRLGARSDHDSEVCGTYHSPQKRNATFLLWAAAAPSDADGDAAMFKAVLDARWEVQLWRIRWNVVCGVQRPLPEI